MGLGSGPRKKSTADFLKHNNRCSFHTFIFLNFELKSTDARPGGALLAIECTGLIGPASPIGGKAMMLVEFMVNLSSFNVFSMSYNL